MATAEHRRVDPGDLLYDGPPRCSCGAFYPCEAVSATAVAESAERADAGLHAPKDDDQRYLLGAVATGWTLFELDPNDCLDFQPRGGIVVEVHVDDDGRRSFTLASARHGRVEIFELNQDQVAPPGDYSRPNVLSMRELARAMKRQKFTGLVDGFEVRLAQYTLILLERAA